MKLSKKIILLVFLLLILLIIGGIKLRSIQIAKIANDRSVPSISEYVSPFEPKYGIGELNSNSNSVELLLASMGPGEAYRNWNQSDRINFVRSNVSYNGVPLRDIQLKSVQLEKIDKRTEKLIFITSEEEMLIVTMRY